MVHWPYPLIACEKHTKLKNFWFFLLRHMDGLCLCRMSALWGTSTVLWIQWFDKFLTLLTLWECRSVLTVPIQFAMSSRYRFHYFRESHRIHLSMKIERGWFDKNSGAIGLAQKARNYRKPIKNLRKWSEIVYRVCGGTAMSDLLLSYFLPSLSFLS